MKLSTPIYLNSAAQLSIQEPLSDAWMHYPRQYEAGDYATAINPDFKKWIPVVEARRLGVILRRAIAVSEVALSEAAVQNPDAIITATGLGCMKNTELFLSDMTYNGESLLKPTQFMQSTHNTIGSLVAIRRRCHGYNVTYANADVSFESALYDALLQLNAGDIHSALVGAYDEMTPDYYRMLVKAGYYAPSMTVPSGETAVAMVLTDRHSADSLARIEAVELCYNKTPDYIQSLKPDLIVAGFNGITENDHKYRVFIDRYFPGIDVKGYKDIFGESPTASAYGVYMAAKMLSVDNRYNRILILNISKKYIAYTLLSRS